MPLIVNSGCFRNDSIQHGSLTLIGRRLHRSDTAACGRVHTDAAKYLRLVFGEESVKPAEESDK